MSDPLAPGTVLHDRYTIELAVQAGQKAAVYRATDAQGAAKAVLIREGFDTSPEAQARFTEEVEAVQGIEHPSLPVVIDHFIEPSARQYVVTLDVDGPDLQRLLASGTRLREAEVLAWFEQILSAVERLHNLQPPVIHGAIRPSNVRISQHGLPRLSGLLDASRLLLTGTEARPDPHDPYSAPEQRTGLASERSDIYALGATLYALLTGKVPPSATDRLANAPLPRPRRVTRAISPHVEAAIRKAMALDPEERFPTVEQFSQALQVPAHPAPPALRSTAPLIGVGIAIPVLAVLLFWQLVLPNLGRAIPVRAAPTLEPTRPPVIVWSSRTPTLTRTPRPTRMATATPMLTPTFGPLIVPTDQPLPRPTRTPRPAITTAARPAPAPTITPRWYPPPTLVSPGPGAVISGDIQFRWSWDYVLAEDEYFDLQVWRIGTEPAGIAWCREPYYRASSLLTGSGDYYWRVQIIRGVDGQVQALVSDPSDAWGLKWTKRPE